MKLGKFEIVILLIALFAGLHFYNQSRLDKTAFENEHFSTFFYDEENPPVIVAFGDSLTYGTGARGDKIDMSYPALLSKLLGNHVINEGIPGETTDKAFTRLLGVLKKYRPEVLILCEGGNDMLRSRKPAIIKNNLKKMVDAALDAGTKVILLGVPEPNQFFLKDAKFYRKLAEESGILYLPNIFSDVLSYDSLTKDHIHPNESGYAIIPQKIYKVIKGESL